MGLGFRYRRWLSGWLIVALLFMQFAAAAYACPRAATAPPEAAAMADMPGCDGSMPQTMDPGQPQLCKAHCEQGDQTVGPLALGEVPSIPLLFAVLDWTEATLATAPARRTSIGALSGAPPLGSAPLYLALLVLRN